MDQFEEALKKYSEYINSKAWGDLTSDDIELIEDIEKRKEFRQKYQKCFRYVINPLYSSIKSRNFKFSNPDNLLTCRNMMSDLMKYYYKKGFTRDEIINIACENDCKKKY